MAAFLRPIFLIMKLEPMKMLEDRAKQRPITLSEDIPIMMMFHHNIKMIPKETSSGTNKSTFAGPRCHNIKMIP